MPGKREEKREALRKALISSAVKQIDAGGSTALRARDLAKEAGCALGAIYTHFEDLEELAFFAKAEIYRRMDLELTKVMDAVADESPRVQMNCLASSYFGFAVENANLWQAIFAENAVAEDRVPEWYRNSLVTLMSHISRPLHELRPDLDDAALALRTRTIFSAIHGIVLLALQKRPSGVPLDDVPSAMEQVVEAFS
ncbi:MAG: TetR/AcrR family transcriptional regulator [Pseudomonadota bacterium]